MKRYVLSPGAQRDLVGITNYYEEAGGYRVARRMLAEFAGAFRALARTPGAGHRRADLAGNRSLLFWPIRDYLIVYRRDPGVQVVAVVHGNRDVASFIDQRVP